MAKLRLGLRTPTFRRSFRSSTMTAALMIPLSSTLLFSSGLFARADEQNVPGDAQIPAAKILLHKSGAVTITLRGIQHRLGPLEFGKQAKDILKGESTVLIAMEDWSNFERVAGERMPILYEAGIRSITLQAVDKGETKVRTLPLGPPSLALRIADRDPVVRRNALDEIEAMLKSDKSSDRCTAMSAILSSQKVRYDRRRYLPHVRNILAEAKKGEIGQAIGTIGVVGGNATDLPTVLGHVEDSDERVRAEISTALYGLDPEAKDPRIGPAIERLLADPASWVRVATYKSLWGRPTTPGVDAKLIEMSRGPSHGGSSEADEVVYYALSTRPVVSKPVAERLIETYQHKEIHAGRAVWGLAHTASDDAKPRIVDFLIQVLDDEIDRETRQEAIHGLGIHGGDKAIRKLQEIASNPNESRRTREHARRRLPPNVRPTALAANAPMPPNPGQREEIKELWQKISQPQDAAIRQAALATVEQMLAKPDSAGDGLKALVQSREADIDRTRFIPLIRPLRTSANPEVRAYSIVALAAAGGGIDLPTVAACAKDDSSVVRAIVAETIRLVDPKAEHPLSEKTIASLIGDEDSKVILATIHSLWGYPTSSEVEAALIDLSFHSEFGYDTVYYALSTRPIVRKPVAQRLLDLIETSNEHRGRAIWGLSHHPVAADAKDLVATALIQVVDDGVDGYDRSNAIRGLGALKTDAARRRLERIVETPSEPTAAKKLASALLAGFAPRPR